MQSNPKEALALFSEKLGYLLGSGVPLVPALETVMAEISEESLVETCRQVLRRIGEGKGFHEALAEAPNIFSPSFLGMVRAAEHQGTLDSMMGKIARGLRDGLVPVGGTARGKEEFTSSEAEEAAHRLIFEAVARKASDVHIVPTRDGLIVSYRIDGRLIEVKRFASPMKEILTARLKSWSHLDLGEQNLPQDGRMNIRVQGKTVDIRVNILPTGFGEKITLRVVPAEDVRLRPEDIFDDPADREAFFRLIDAPFGLVVIAGPSGSGKTTTAYCALQTLKERWAGAITTVESTIEVVLEGIAQTQIRPWIGMTSTNILNAVDRTDPDVIFVGDVQNEETVQKILKLVLTGHLVIIQLSASTIEDVFDRLRALRAPAHLLASAIRGVMVQRLVRKVCPDCSRDVKLPAADLKAIGWRGTQVKAREGAGCNRCNQSGYRGRRPVYDFFQADKGFKDCLQAGDPDQIRGWLGKSHQRSLRQSVGDLVATGKTSLAEAERVLRD